MNPDKKKPTCYIIAGPNGAGKTTFAMTYLPKMAECCNFVNADFIAFGLSPLNSIAVQFDAGRIFLKEIYRFIEQRVNFAFETTLAGRSHLSLIKKLRKDGWNIVLLFLWIPDPDFSRDRVRQRVEEGGHDIPDEAIYRRFPRIMYNFQYLYIPQCDEVYCYDNSSPNPVLIFEQSDSDKNVIQHEHYKNIVRCANEYRENK